MARSIARRNAADATITELFRANAADLLAYFTRRVSPAEDAADLLSETMLIAFRRWRDLPARSEEARMWMFASARNVLANYVRGRHRQHALAAKLAAELALASQSVEAGRASELREAIDGLRPQARELVMLIYWDGFSIAEAAQLMRISPSTARGRIASIRSALHQQLTVDAHTQPGDPSK